MVQRALEAEAPNFVDFVGQTLAESYPGLTTTTNQAVDVHTTLDLHLQRLAQDAVRDGLLNVDQLLSRRKRRGKAEAALIAVDPKTGEILALVGGRSYNQSQYNRVIASRRQPGSVFKPFVYLTAFEQAADTAQTDITPATIVDDDPETFEFDDQVWTPENYEKTYDGPITYRHALAHSRNLATIHVAQAAGYDRVAALWKKVGVGTVPKAYPSIALGVFEATPYEIASAYTLFPNQGLMRPLQHILTITSGGKNVTKKTTAAAAAGRPRRDELPRHRHDAQRDERGNRRRRPNGRVHAQRGGQDRNHQRPARRLVRRVHAGPPDGRVGRVRRQSAGRAERRAGGASDLDAVHDARAGRPRERGVRRARRDRVRGHRCRHRQARHAGLPARLPRSVPRRHPTDDGV